MIEKIFIMGKTDSETEAVSLIVAKQKEFEHTSASKIVISKVLDLRNMRIQQNGYFVPVQYVYEKMSKTGYVISSRFISEEQVKTQYPDF